jgi:DNA-directed RNA polymerase specialized sigma24 family protein
MNQLKDEELIFRIKKGKDKNKCFSELVNRYEKVYYKICHKYTLGRDKESKVEALLNKESFFYEALLNYDENKKTKFSTYLSSILKWKLIKEYHNSKKATFTELDENAKYEDHYTSKEFNLVSALNELKKDRDSRVYKIFKLRYLDGEGNKLMPWNKVCTYLDLSIQGCIDIHNKFLEKKRKIFTKPKKRK